VWCVLEGVDFLGFARGGNVGVWQMPSYTPGSATYLTAGLEVLALGVDALVVVDVVLPAVLGLVLVREAGVEASSHELEGHGHALLVVGHVCGISRGISLKGVVVCGWIDCPLLWYAVCDSRSSRVEEEAGRGTCGAKLRLAAATCDYRPYH
jgi:hypothetical protein